MRRLPVISRDSQAAYRVRGYLAAETAKGATTISWVWDVFDNDGRRALRISGTEAAPGKHRDAWAAADDARAAAHRSRQHGPARRLSDLTRCCAGRTAETVAALDRQAVVAGGGRDFPHFPRHCRPGPGPGRGRRRRRKRLPSRCRCPRRRPTTTAAVAAQAKTGQAWRPPSAERRRLKSRGIRHSPHIAACSPPCYDHAACGVGA